MRSPASSLFCVLAMVSQLFAQQYGLQQRPNVGPYLDGVMPAQPPAIGSDWSTVLAFPNLTFQNPMGIAQMPGQDKMVVWEREGRVYFFEKATEASTKTLMIDVSARCQGWDDSGLLNVAFHPNFSLSGAPGTNRYVFLFYTYTAGPVQGDANSRPPTFIPVRDRLSRFTLDANGVAISGSETVFIDQFGESVWHNGGGMFFHPENGFLYLTDGDDANGGNTQRIDGGLFSGVWRIDVDRRGGSISHAAPRTPANATVANYFIPNDNPFVGVPNANEEFFAIGLRSPHRMTIDPLTKRIFIGDVGAGSREEISVIEPGESGLNFQWDRIEGLGGDLTVPHIGTNKRPTLDYGHNEGGAIIGGYVYRGPEFAAELGGRYVFGDNITNNIYVMDESTTPAGKTLLTTLPKGTGPNSGNDYVGLSSFGVDAQGELYLCQLSSVAGRIYKLQRGGTASQPLPATLSATGVFGNTAAMTPSARLIPYALNQPFWSDGAIKSRWAVIPTNANVGFAPTGEWTWPEGAVLVKHFDLPVDETDAAVRKRLETRLLVKMASGAVYGATYKWRADNSDADLLDSALTENVSIAMAPIGTFTGADIGAPQLAGSTARVGNLVTIQAGGTDIWGSADQFHFASQPRTGDFDIPVRIESLGEADLYSKAGLMVRESLTPGSRHVFALVFPSNAVRNNNDGGYEFQSRAVGDGPSAAIYPAAPQPRVSYPNGWLRLRREGDTFIAFSSADGAMWTEFARQTIALPQTVFFGFAVTSHTAAATTTAVFHLQTARLQPWYYPSRQNCVTCHNTNAGGVLGPKTRQLNGTLQYPGGVTDNQIRAWAHIGLFDNAPAEAQIASFDKLAALHDVTVPIEKRVRSYLDANCANCHRPNGVQAFWDARYDTPLAQQGILYGTLGTNLGDPTARVIVPQDLLRSVLHRRVNAIGTIQMPPLAKNRVDTVGADLLAQWIASLPQNTPPAVAIVSPPNNTSFLQGAPISLTAAATDSDGIQKVEYYDGLYKLGEATTAPYPFTWQNAARGNHPITAIALDGVGNSAQSAVVNVQVVGAPLPSPWLHRDIGNVGLLGDASYGAGAFTVAGSGDDIWGGADAFHFVHRTLEGDGEIIARVVSVQNTDGWAKAGVMMRETLNADSRYAFALVSASNGTALQLRRTPGGEAEHTGGPGGAAPMWVRLVREGDVFSAYSSADGTAWTLIGSQTVAMGASIQAGLAVTAHNNAVLNEAVFDNVSWNAGTLTFSAKVNFQLAGVPIPPGYLPDTGGVFEAQSGGFSYGWSRDNAADARDRDNPGAPDQRYDTLLHFQKIHGDGSSTSAWEFALASGQYQVRVVAGDPSNIGDSRHHLLVEGQTIMDAVTTGAQPFLEATATFDVADGRLTVSPGANAVNAKICFIEISSFSVEGNQRPAVILAQPLDGARFVNVPSVPVLASASDADGTVAKVEFLVDGVKQSEVSTAPYEWSWTPSYGSHTVTARAVDNAGASSAASATCVAEVAGVAGFRAQYFDNMDLSGASFVRVDAAVDFDWGGGGPDARIGPETFSARWTGQVRPRFTQNYTFTVEADDGVRLWVNGTLLIDQWRDQGPTRYSANLPIVADQPYDVVMEYFENGGGAVARLLWSSNSQTEEPIPASRATVPAPVNLPPQVALTKPVAGATFLETDAIPLEAGASDPDGYVARVEFWADGVKLGEDAQAPFTLDWLVPHGLGVHSINAVAFDAAGASATDSAVAVEVMRSVLKPVGVQHLTNPDRTVSTLRFTLPAGRHYAVEWSADLVGWNILTTGTAGAAPIEVTDTAEGVQRRFFRLKVD